MGFLDKAKQAANDMAAKADQAMANAGIAGPPGAPGAGANRAADAALRDFGLISWREAHGQRVDATEKERVLNALRTMESSGQLAALRVGGGPSGGGLFGSPSPGAPPPPPGAAAAAAAQGQGYAAPPPPAPPAPPSEPPSAGSAGSGSGSAPPPPPPSWA